MTSLVCNLHRLSIQREVRSSGLVTSVCVTQCGAVFDSREKRVAVRFAMSVWDHCSLSSTNNLYFIARKTGKSDNRSLTVHPMIQVSIKVVLQILFYLPTLINCDGHLEFNRY